MAGTNTKKMTRRTPWLLLAGYWILLAISTHIPRIPSGMEIHVKDKVIHFVAFLVLTLLFWLASFGTQRPRLRGWPLWLVLVLLSAYGAVDEITQGYVGRNVSLLDWLSDFSGVIVALAMLMVMRRWIYWLMAYWLALLIVTHWPGAVALIKLPPFLQQFHLVYYLGAYIALAVLWWRSWCVRSRFMVNPVLIVSTVIAIGGYACFDQWLAGIMNHPNAGIKLPVALFGMGVGMAFSILMARHQEEMERRYPVLEPSEG